MKVTVERTPPPPPPSDLPGNPACPRKPPRRRTKGSVRLKRESAKRTSRPETPLLRWKFDDDNKSAEEEEEKSPDRKCRRRTTRSPVSSRKIAASLWRLRLPEFETSVGHRAGLESGVDHFGATVKCQHLERGHHVYPAKDDTVHSPKSVPGSKNRPLHKFEPSFQFPNHAMEGATKWDPHGWKASNETNQQSPHQLKPPERRAPAPAPNPALEAELDQARARIVELETERKSSKKKLEQFLRKLSEERAAWRTREHEKVRAIIEDAKSDLSREKKTRHRLEVVNSKLVNELADAKQAAKRYMQEYEKERKARELIEEVCDELAKEIGEDKAEVEALTRETLRLREEVEEDKRMLQMAEVWREERVQMKLADSKVMLENKYTEMKTLVAGLESFLKSSKASDSEEIKRAEFLMQAARSLSIHDVRELTYEPPNPDDIFSVFEDGNFGEPNGPCDDEYSPASHASKIHTVSPEVKMHNKDRARAQHRFSNAYVDQSGEFEEDASEWETVSHPEDQGSSYSPEESDRSVNKNFRVSNVSRHEVDSVRMRREMRRGSSVSKVWKNGDNNYKIITVDGKNGRLSNGRISNGAMMSSPDHDELSGQWSSPDSGNPHINRAMKGCIEWPRTGHGQKNSLKSRLLEARMESQKVQLRQVLKQKI